MAKLRQVLPGQLRRLDVIAWGGQGLVVSAVGGALPLQDGTVGHQVLCLGWDGELVVAVMDITTPVPVFFYDPADRAVT